MKPAVIFDLDGTLIDSAPDIHASANRVFAPHGESFTRAEVQGFVGRGAPNLISRLARSRGMPGAGAAFDDLLARFLTVYEQSHTLTTLYPGVPSALRELSGAGARLGLCTNKPIAPTQAVLAHFGLACFGAVVGGDSLPVKKPDPAPLLHALKMLGDGPMIFVGDSEVDAETAQAAGVPFVLFTEGYRKTPVEALPHHAAFADFAELPTLVAGISASFAP
jgi:phosphoglycolate phosphatase